MEWICKIAVYERRLDILGFLNLSDLVRILMEDHYERL